MCGAESRAKRIRQESCAHNLQGEKLKEYAVQNQGREDQARFEHNLICKNRTETQVQSRHRNIQIKNLARRLAKGQHQKEGAMQEKENWAKTYLTALAEDEMKTKMLCSLGILEHIYSYHETTKKFAVHIRSTKVCIDGWKPKASMTSWQRIWEDSKLACC